MNAASQILSDSAARHDSVNAAAAQTAITRAEKFLILLFVLTLPFICPRVRGDGIGYYAFARSLIVDHNLQFKGDWKDVNARPMLVERDRGGRIISASVYTSTGHLDNHYSVGPAILWSPFLIATHLAVLAADHAGFHVAPDGFSWPYLVTMAAATAFYGFAGLWLSFRLARKYFDERWALLATLGIWFASSLPAYMYADPSWSHALSAFAVALFLWHWDRTRGNRSLWQWVVLGLIAGLMIDTYYMNATLLLFPAIESASQYRRDYAKQRLKASHALQQGLLFGASLVLVVLPTLITKKILYGRYFNLGYTEHWFWGSPAFWKVCFSMQHGMFSLTPILLVAVAGLAFLWKRDRQFGTCAAATFTVFLYVMGCYELWHGVVSFGNRFFISLTPIFILGLAAAFSEFRALWNNLAGATRRIAAVTVLLSLWNVGLVFQWSTGLLPDVTPVVWRDVVYNQFRVVPGEMLDCIQKRITRPESILSANRYN